MVDAVAAAIRRQGRSAAGARADRRARGSGFRISWMRRLAGSRPPGGGLRSAQRRGPAGRRGRAAGGVAGHGALQFLDDRGAGLRRRRFRPPARGLRLPGAQEGAPPPGGLHLGGHQVLAPRAGGQNRGALLPGRHGGRGACSTNRTKPSSPRSRANCGKSPASPPARVLRASARWPRSMAQYTVGHPQRLAEMEARAAAIPGLYLAGNAYNGIGIPDCIRMGRRPPHESWGCSLIQRVEVGQAVPPALAYLTFSWNALSLIQAAAHAFLSASGASGRAPGLHEPVGRAFVNPGLVELARRFHLSPGGWNGGVDVAGPPPRRNRRPAPGCWGWPPPPGRCRRTRMPPTGPCGWSRNGTPVRRPRRSPPRRPSRSSRELLGIVGQRVEIRGHLFGRQPAGRPPFLSAGYLWCVRRSAAHSPTACLERWPHSPPPPTSRPRFPPRGPSQFVVDDDDRGRLPRRLRVRDKRFDAPGAVFDRDPLVPPRRLVHRLASPILRTERGTRPSRSRRCPVAASFQKPPS